MLFNKHWVDGWRVIFVDRRPVSGFVYLEGETLRRMNAHVPQEEMCELNQLFHSTLSASRPSLLSVMRVVSSA